MNKNLYRRHLVIIVLYSLLTLLLTWPLAARPTSHIPGEATWAFDESTFIWNMWWFKHSLLNLQQAPLHTTYIFFPVGINLTTYTFNLFNAAFGLPLQLALSLPLANNLTLIFSFIASAYGTCLLVQYFLRPLPPTNYRLPITTLAAFAAGAVYAFSASRMMYLALGHYNFVTIQWFPFYTLFLLKALRRGGLKNIFMAGLFAALCLYAELTFGVFLLFLTVIILAAEWKTVTPRASFITRPLLIALVTFTLAAPFILAVLPDFLDPAYSEPGWGEGLKLSADLAGLVALTPLHPLYPVDWIPELRAVIEGTSRFSDANTLFLGYGILALALLGFITHRRQTQVWLWAGVIFTVLSLGPLLTINGQNRFNLDGLEVTFPLPFALLHYLPILSANRVPNRFGIPLTLALAVLAGYGAAWLLHKIERWVNGATQHQPPNTPHVPHPTLHLLITTLLLTLLLFDQYSIPLPLTDARIPRPYYQIGAEAGNFTLMQLPLGWRNSYGTLGAERTQLQYYQAVHQRPMLGGNTSRNPQFKFDYYARIPLFAALTGAELYRTVDESTLERARQQAAELMALYNIKYLAIHQPIPFRKPYEDTYLATRKMALDLIPHHPEPVYQSPEVEVFAVTQADPPNPLLIDFGNWPADPYRGQGWSDNEEIFAATANWAIAPQAEIFFPATGGGNRQLTLQIAPFSYPNAPQQQVDIELNGQWLDNSFSLHEGWQSVEVQLPADGLVEGLNRLTLHFAHTAQPRRVLPGSKTIGSTGATTPVDLEVNSGADFAFITVGYGAEAVDASAHRRGVNLAVVDSRSGQVTNFRGFDTAANEFEASALAQFIAEIPAGQIVLVASQGLEATTYFKADTLAALESLGLSAQGLTPPFSAIGVKGAPPGTALQAAGEGSAYLRRGDIADARPLAAAVDKIVITKP